MRSASASLQYYNRGESEHSNLPILMLARLLKDLTLNCHLL
jgi:hypothetical protein